MADFRRWITALAVATLFVGLASAQVGTGGGNSNLPFTCSANVAVTPTIRSEGNAEATGDIVLQCQGGSPLALGSQIPTVNITVFYNVPNVTSRLMGNVSGVNASEALLMIDEPGSGLSGYGPQSQQKLCSSTTQGAGPAGCAQLVGTNGNTTGGPTQGVPVDVAGNLGSSTSWTGNPGSNVFQGIVVGQSVQFYGIPVLAPVTAGLSRIYRITNVRVNANGAGGGVAGGPGTVVASISTTGSTSIPINNPTPIVAFISPGLSTSVSGAATLAQCNRPSQLAGILAFSENFGTAFKTRVDQQTNGNGVNPKAATQIQLTGPLSSGYAQSVPGGTTASSGAPSQYNSESDIIYNIPGSSAGLVAGLADFGTRLKAVFTNVPANMTVYVSTVNVTSNANSYLFNVTTGFNGVPSGTNTTSFAQLVSGESNADSGGVIPALAYTNTFITASSSSGAANFVPYYAMTSNNQPLVATWEVVNTNPAANETFYFAVWVSGPTPTQTSPPAPTTATVNLSFAPNPTNGTGGFTASSAGTANFPIPRFADTSTARTIFTINQCNTVLLFPYVNTTTGFETGIAIANTSTDPFGTINQVGTCTLNWYQGPNNPAPSVIGPVASGTVTVLGASDTKYAGQNFSGYMIAVCNFQLAHGTAIITDVGARGILTTYLALVVSTSQAARNGNTPEAFNN